MVEIKKEAFVLKENGSDWESLGVFEMAPGRDLCATSFRPYGTYEKQAEDFRGRAERDYGRAVILVDVEFP